jgi:hypothetical protein
VRAATPATAATAPLAVVGWVRAPYDQRPVATAGAPAGRQGPAVEGRGRAVGICLGAAPDEGAALRLPGGAVPQNASADDMATG